MKTRIAVRSLPAARLALMVSAVLAGAALAVLATPVRAQSPAPAKAAAATPAANASAVKLSVNGMVCAFCAQGIEARLKKLPETADLYINLKQKVVAVQAKPWPPPRLAALWPAPSARWRSPFLHPWWLKPHWPLARLNTSA